MATITLTNEFHGTEISLRPKDGVLSKGQVKKAERALCGVEGCTCGGIAGTRGRQPGFQLDYGRDGTARVLPQDTY